MPTEFNIYRIFIKGKTGLQIKALLDSKTIPVIRERAVLEAPTWELEGECGANFFDLYIPTNYLLAHVELAERHGLIGKTASVNKATGLKVARYYTDGNPGDSRADSSVVNQANSLF